MAPSPLWGEGRGEGRGRIPPAGFTPLQVSDILATVDFFQGLLPALIVNITAFRIGLEDGCRPAPSA